MEGMLITTTAVLCDLRGDLRTAVSGASSALIPNHPKAPCKWRVKVCKWSESHSVMSDSVTLYGLYSPWDSPGQNTGVGSCSLLQGIFPTHGFNPGLLHWRGILSWLSHRKVPGASSALIPNHPKISCLCLQSVAQILDYPGTMYSPL